MTYRVLVIDDNRAIHEDITKVLTQSDLPDQLTALEQSLFGDDPPRRDSREPIAFEIDSAFQGKDGLVKVMQARDQSRPYSLAFVDVRMPPGWDGVETIAHLWDADPLLQAVICTAHSDYSWSDIDTRLGQSDNLLIVKKPFDIIEIRQAAHTLARKWTAQNQARLKLEELESLVHQRTMELSRINESLTQEVQERLRAEERLKHLVAHDPLTGLPNRVLFSDRLDHALARTHRTKKWLAVGMVDVDHFKQINDTLGHEAGDRLLQLVAARLRKCAREMDTVARLSGDEFALLLEDLESPDNVHAFGKRLIAAFEAPFPIGEGERPVTISVGFCAYPGDGVTTDNLLKTADCAMYESKAAGRSAYRVFAPERESPRASILGDEIKVALEERQFELYYQPLYDIAAERITGVEALLRWRHPERGLIPAMDFIPTAEKSGEILPIGEWVFRTACSQVKKWQEAGVLPITVAVNVSAKQLFDERLPNLIRSVLSESKVPGAQLEIEINESATFRDLRKSREILQAVRALGVRIVIDDFGTGESSLSRLRQLPIDGLKIDRGILRDAVSNQHDASLVRAIVVMANALGLAVVAEGIETQEQLDFLRNIDWKQPCRLLCERGQGYLLCRPLPAAEVLTLMLKGARPGTSFPAADGGHP